MKIIIKLNIKEASICFSEGGIRYLGVHKIYVREVNDEILPLFIKKFILILI